MTPGEISRLWRGTCVGREILVYPEVDSTNDLALQMGRRGVAEGLVIFAEAQKAGRGRLGRKWEAAPGKNLLFSILLRPTWRDVSRISLAVAVAVSRVLAARLPQPVGIKWPNDIFVGGKKLAGILCEAGEGIVVAGVGINVGQTLEDFPTELRERATSLQLLTGTPWHRPTLAAQLLAELDLLYRSLPDGFPEVIAECEQRSVLLGKTIVVEIGHRHIAGEVAGIDASGALAVREADGRHTLVSAGEVTLLRS